MDFCKTLDKKVIQNSTITINSIYNYLSEEGKKPKWFPIESWREFEQGLKEYTEEEIRDMFFIDSIQLLQSELTLITMESYSKNISFEFRNISEFLLLINNYDKIVDENIEFMQPMDYILINQDLSFIVMIHHEGFRFKYSEG
ncbi:hypothetical protein [Bernardetia sp.]|uniref:hypothetical protein n=1 Tax=Bernardetia sp. TaxID=1937974 RepID=UPI0025BA9D1B|nr:hypothetical protein [Bernardetia sp.]